MNTVNRPEGYIDRSGTGRKLKKSLYPQGEYNVGLSFLTHSTIVLHDYMSNDPNIVI
jgi:hypothetical protein